MAHSDKESKQDSHYADSTDPISFIVFFPAPLIKNETQQQE